MSKYKIGDKVLLKNDNEGIIVKIEKHELGDYIVEACGQHHQIPEDYISGVIFAEEKAKRYNSGKVEFDDMPLIGITEVAKVAAYGQKKYSKNNWRQSAPTTQYLNCAMRHIMKYMYGEEVDPESQGMHLAHAAWNLLALIEKVLMKKDDDDRFIYDTDANLDEIFQLSENQKK